MYTCEGNQWLKRRGVLGSRFFGRAVPAGIPPKTD